MMRITDLLKPESIRLNAAAVDKEDAIRQAVALMEKNGNLTDAGTYLTQVLAREAESTTGAGEGIAIPHAKTPVVSRAGLASMVLPAGVDFDAPDGQPAKLIFLIAAPDTDDNIHLDVLSRLSMLLMDDALPCALMDAKTTDEFLARIDAAETARFPKTADVTAAPAATGSPKKTGDGAYRVLAVTACPTGIAHTYMAAEGLKSAAGKLGVTLKVETDGSGGAKNVLTPEEIRQAEVIIVAADTGVPMARFAGKRVLQAKVADGISKPEQLIRDALSGNVPVYAGGNAQAPAAKAGDGERESAGRTIYRHLMSGVSHMLPFVIGGGILIAIAFLLDDFFVDPANFGMNTPTAAVFKIIGDAAFGLMLPILSGYIAYSIGDRPALAPGIVGGILATVAPSAMFDGLTGAADITGFFGMIISGASTSGFFGALIAGFAAGYLIVGIRKLADHLPAALEGIKAVLIYPVSGVLAIGLIMVFWVNPPMGVFNAWLSDTLAGMGESSRIMMGVVLGGMMSIDFGGPLNKAAYVFGTAAIASGQYHIMASVMIGGMVPPLSIALATILFRRKFTRRERQSGATNFILGLSFITEGAIPFAAADPLRVIPSCMVGAAAAGGLSMAFGCTLPAPHGGIFVFPVVGNPLLYLLALIIGSVGGGILYGLLRRPAAEETGESARPAQKSRPSDRRKNPSASPVQNI